MKTGLEAFGYTIVEVMVVLAVTGIMVVSALLMVGGQQQKTQFNQSIHDIQSKINETISNVASGYYARPSDNFTCSASAQGPKFTFSGTANSEGTEQACIVVGRAMQFGVAGNLSSYGILNLAGLRQTGGGIPVSNLNEAKPVAMSPDTTGTFFGNTLTDTAESNSLRYGLEVKYMYYTDTSDVNHPTSVMALVTNFPDSSKSNQAGGRSLELYSIDNTANGVVNSCVPSGCVVTGWTNLSQQQAVDAIDSRFLTIPYNFKSAKSATICLDSDTGKHAVITIGGQSELAANLAILNGSC